MLLHVGTHECTFRVEAPKEPDHTFRPFDGLALGVVPVTDWETGYDVGYEYNSTGDLILQQPPPPGHNTFRRVKGLQAPGFGEGGKYGLWYLKADSRRYYRPLGIRF